MTTVTHGDNEGDGGLNLLLRVPAEEELARGARAKHGRITRFGMLGRVVDRRGRGSLDSEQQQHPPLLTRLLIGTAGR